MISSELSLRLARPIDATTIANMSRLLIEVGLQWRWTPKRVTASILDPDTNVLVGRIGDQTIGFAIMRYGENVAHLDLLAVAPAFHRGGVGRQMVAWLEKCAVVAGIFKVALEVRATNEAAHLFYQHMGYRTLIRIPRYYQGVEDALRMGRDLACGANEDGNNS